MTQGFAAVNHRGEILIKTVSDTRRAAMVNWLVAEGRVIVFQTDTDEDIEKSFLELAGKRGLALIEPVTIAISSPDQGGK
jgi:hypothetical protein